MTNEEKQRKLAILKAIHEYFSQMPKEEFVRLQMMNTLKQKEMVNKLSKREEL